MVLFDDEIVCLVNNANGKNLYQSINQSLLNGVVWRDNSKDSDHTQRVFHDSVGYIINNNGNEVKLTQGKQLGSWKAINIDASASEISRDVFSLGLNLGNSLHGTFSYSMLPAISLDQFRMYKPGDHVIILQNNNGLQAVYQKKLDQVQAIFYKAGKLQLPWNNLAVVMKKAGLVMIKKINNKLIVDYSQPFPKIHLEWAISNKTALENEAISISSN